MTLVEAVSCVNANSLNCPVIVVTSTQQRDGKRDNTIHNTRETYSGIVTSRETLLNRPVRLITIIADLPVHSLIKAMYVLLSKL